MRRIPLVALAIAFGACGSAAPRLTSPSGVPTVVASTTTRRTTTTTRPRTTTTSRPLSAASPVPMSVTGDQAIVVTGTTITAYARSSGTWRAVFGPWTGHVGRAGIAPAGAKREGDSRTPSGTYGFDFAFGLQPDPGVHLPYRRVTGRNIVWDDDPASADYNEWVDTTQADAGANPEPMDQTPAYDYGVVIAYNSARTPGLGSAIFLHVDTGRPTAGCVSLPRADLLDVLRWLDPVANPTITISP